MNRVVRTRQRVAAAVVVAALVAVAVGIVVTRSPQAGSTSSTVPAVLAGRFLAVRTGVFGVIASGDYAVSTIDLGLAQGAVVVDDRTGVRTPLYRGCFVEGIGDPWLLLGCPQVGADRGGYGLQLYSLPTAARQPVADNPNLPYSPCDDEFLRCAFPDGVGAQWIRFDARCSGCQDAYFFENIQTAQVRADPTSATTFADLSSPDLTRSTCAGVRVLPRSAGGRSGWGALTLYGRVAVATGSDAAGRDAAYLERCGTPGRRLLAEGSTSGTPPPVASNARSIVWQTAPSRLSGVFLPSLRPFTIPLPGAIVAAEGPETRVAALALTSHALYVLDRLGGRLWRLSVETGRDGSQIHPLHEPG